MSVFSSLDLDTVLNILEEASGVRLTGHNYSLPSYVNRVLEVESEEGRRMVAKFYRPGRWTRKALQEEHDYLHDCVQAEIPVVAPLKLYNGQSLGEWEGIHFVLFPRRSGRLQEFEGQKDYRQLGQLVGRLHRVGESRPCSHRRVLHPGDTDEIDLERISEYGMIPPHLVDDFFCIADEIVDRSWPLFDETKNIRIHGDLHRGNLLHRPDEGSLLIDFDDMMWGSPAQDLWLLLPDYLDKAQNEWNWIVEGYAQFREVDPHWERQIEALRALRMLHFLAWISLQSEEPHFSLHFPEWGTESFWRQEIADLREQRLRLP